MSYRICGSALRQQFRNSSGQKQNEFFVTIFGVTVSDGLAVAPLEGPSLRRVRRPPCRRRQFYRLSFSGPVHSERPPPPHGLSYRTLPERILKIRYFPIRNNFLRNLNFEYSDNFLLLRGISVRHRPPSLLTPSGPPHRLPPRLLHPPT